jgi:hypothetical protein
MPLAIGDPLEAERFDGREAISVGGYRPRRRFPVD